MSLDNLFEMLVGADKQAQSDAPYRGFADTVGQLGNAAILGSVKRDEKGNSTQSMTESILGPLILGALGGLADKGNQSYVADRNAEAMSTLTGILGGLNPERPSQMSPSIYSNLGNAAKFYDLEQRAGIDSENRKAGNDLRNLIAGERIKGAISNPYTIGKQNDAINQVVNGQSATAAQPVVQTGAPKLSDYMDQAQGDEATAKLLMQRDLEKPDRLTTLRKEFSAKPEVQNFLYADTGFKAMQEAFKDTSGQSDIELTRRAIQAIEPGLAVRTDDQNAITSSASLPESYKASMLGALTGNTKLSPDVREGLMRIAQRSYNAYGDQFNKALGFYKTQAENAQLDPSGISYQDQAKPSTASFSTLTDLAKSFPNTPEGKAAFKAKATELGY